ncbi:SchA/CurD-like domain-containing protein [Actinoalloteichus caeruleus]|uniref:SchA/CurD-like domain-containing protein n=1 Tax=Actinoalloteichus cyanogriseus TaxID=2893586 RepID=UPI0006921358|nr:SchA/CurD-like domain-containing protein [Actinoalloteichus caeruleus]
MPHAAALFRLQPGDESEIARPVDGSDGREPRTPLTGPEGGAAAEFRGATPWGRDDVVVRVIDDQGDQPMPVDHLARRPRAHHVEEGGAPFLVGRRDTASPEEPRPRLTDVGGRRPAQHPTTS